MIKSNEIIRIYSKFCVPCVKGDRFKELEAYCRDRGIVLELCRTTYQPALHQEATKIWGDENYTIFLRLRNGKLFDFDEAAKIIEDGGELIVEKPTEKKVKIKKKPITKGKNK